MVALGIILCAMAGIAEAVIDTLEFHYYKSVFVKFNINFWNPTSSWPNKYKNGHKTEGPKFLGSTTIFVWTTDAWHLFKTLQNMLLWAGIVLIAYSTEETIMLLFWVISAKGINRGAFELFYSKIFIK